MAALAGPAGWVVGVDMDQATLEFARAVARERGVANVAFAAADVTERAGPGEYDFVYCRFLLQHLARPVELLRRMWDGRARAASWPWKTPTLRGCFATRTTPGSASTSGCTPRFWPGTAVIPGVPAGW